MTTAIGIDIGGTNIKGVVLNSEGDVMLRHTVPTNDDPEGTWKQTIFNLVNHLTTAQQAPVASIGISCPGFANADNSRISRMPGRLTGVEDFDWGVYLNRATAVLNDAHAALIAESTFGVMKGCKNAVLLTLGTGVGGALLINGELYEGLGRMAGHFGHVTLNPYDDERSILGMPGSLEYALGNYSVQRRSAGRFKTTHELVKGYLDREPFASWLWLDAIRKLGLAIASLVNVLSPEMVVLAGGITKAGEALFAPLNTFISAYNFKHKEKQTQIERARFGDWAGAVGAATFAFMKERKISREMTMDSSQEG